jgi:hypothetical protein
LGTNKFFPRHVAIGGRILFSSENANRPVLQAYCQASNIIQHSSHSPWSKDHPTVHCQTPITELQLGNGLHGHQSIFDRFSILFYFMLVTIYFVFQ